MAEPREVWDDIRWGEEHYADLQRRYRDGWVAIVGGRVVSHGRDLGEVEERAKKLTGKSDVYTLFIESGANIY